MKKKIKTGYAALLAAMLILQAGQPLIAYGQPNIGGVCVHHVEHTDMCGYSLEKGTPCNYQCTECENSEETGTPLPAVERGLTPTPETETGNVPEENNVAGSTSLQSEPMENNDVASVTIDGVTTYYQDIAELQNAVASKTATITLLADLSSGLDLNDGNIILDCNGHTIQGSVYLHNSGHLTITGNGTLNNVYFGYFSYERVSGTIENGTFNGTVMTTSGTPTLTINDGTFNNQVYLSNTTATINGGTFNDEVRLANMTATINGGTFVNCTIVGVEGSTTIKGGTFATCMLEGFVTVNIEGGTIDNLQRNGGAVTVIYNPTVEVSVQSTSAGSITVKELDNTVTFGEAQYSLDGQNWYTSNVLNCHANTTYTVYARYTKAQDKIGTTLATSSPASYNITIPATSLKAGGEDSNASITVDETAGFDLGYNGKVDVTIKNDGSVTTDGKLKLKQKQGTAEITSALLIDGTALGDINASVAAFTMSNKTPVSVSFAKPTETNISAGTYSGTITFVVSYSEP